MGDLTGKLIANTYKDLLQIASSATNEGLDGTLRAIQDGSGNNSSLKISETSAAFTGNVSIAGSLNIGNAFTVGSIETALISATTIRGSTVSVTNITTDTLTAETLTFQDVSVSSLRTGNLTVTNNVTATAYYGNGNNLTVSGVPLETRIEAVSALTVVNQTNIVANTSLIAINQTSISANASAVVALSATLETRIASVSALTAINKTSITANASAVVALSATLETRIASVSTLTAINKSSITANTSAVVALSATLETRIASVSALTAVNKTSITANASAVVALSATLETRIAAVSVLTATNKTSITANASAVVALSATLESRIAALSATVVTSITANASAIVALSATLENRIEVLSATIAELPTDTRIAAVSALTVVNKTSIAANASAVVALSATLETRIAAVSVLTATNKTSIVANASTIVALSATLESRIAALSATVATSISNYLPLTGGTLTGDLNLGDNDKATFGAGNDLQIYHNANTSFITESGSSNFKIGGENLYLQNTAHNENYLAAIANQGVTLYYNNSAKLATTSTGIDVTGNASFADNGKATFGAGDDLQIYHDGNNSYINDAGTGALLIRGSNVILGKYTGETMVNAFADGRVDLYYDNAIKLTTTSAGIDVTGTVDASNLVRFGVNNSEIANNYVRFKPTGTAYIDHSVVGQNINFRLSNASSLDKTVMTLSSTGNVGINTTLPRTLLHVTGLTADDDPALGSSVAPVFISNTANSYGLNIGVNNAGASWLQAQSNTASTAYDILLNPLGGNVGIGTSLPQQLAHINGTGISYFRATGGTGNTGIDFGQHSNGNGYIWHRDSAAVIFGTDSTERMRLDSSGNLLVGKTTTAFGTQGIRLEGPNGKIEATRNGNVVMALNRLTSDGTIAEFAKDGTAVGSIGSYAGTRLRIGSNAGAGMLFGGALIYPATDGTPVNDTHDLGSASYRWKDLYLSGTAYINGIDSNGQVVIDVDNVAAGALRIEANQTNPNNDFYFAQEISSTLSGSTATTGDREQGGIYMDLNSTATGGDTGNEHRVYGMYLDVDSTGDADLVYGVYVDAAATPSTGTTSNVVGGLFRAEDNGGAGNVTNVIGVQGLAISDNATSDSNLIEAGNFRASNVADSGAIGAAIAVTGEIDIVANSGDIYGASKCFSAVYDNNSGVAQTNTTYLFFGDYQGVLPTTAYGIHIADDVWNYFNGNVGIGQTIPAAPLHINKADDQKIILSGSSNPYIRFQEGTTPKAYIQWNAGGGFLQFINMETGLYRFMSTAANQSADLVLIRSDTATVTNDSLGSLNFGHTDGSPDFPTQTKTQLPARIVATAAETASGSDDGANLAFFTKPINADKDTNSIERMRIAASGNVGINTSSPTANLHVFKGESGGAAPNSQASLVLENNSNTYLQFLTPATNESGMLFGDTDNDRGGLTYNHSTDSMVFRVAAAERMRIDSAGKIFMNQGVPFAWTDSSLNVSADIYGDSSDNLVFRNTSAKTERMRISSSGNIGLNKTDPTYAIDQYDSNTVSDSHFRFANGSGGGLQCLSYYGSSILTLASSTGRGLHFSSGGVRPARADTGPNFYNDNAMDLGFVSSRWDDVYATNGTIQTSDRNEKQDIEELSDAEQRVAVAAKGLLRKFRWKDAVNKKGDEARTHFGIIAQDLEDAFTAEGLDAGKYAMFIKSSWWEHEVEIEATEDKEAYTEIHEYETEEEAPDGAVEKIRLGVRYSELLAFIIAAI